MIKEGKNRDEQVLMLPERSVTHAPEDVANDSDIRESASAKAYEGEAIAIVSGKPRPNQIRDRWRSVRLRDAIPILKDFYAGRNTEVGGAANKQLEEAFSSLTNCKHALAVNSGTAALHSAFFALGVQAGDEVILPSYTFFASATPLLQLGARPIFCEIDSTTLTIDVADVESRITERTKAICAVHVWGNPCRMDLLMELSKRTGIPVVEDCSHAHGATFEGKSVGSFGSVGCFSMQGNKAVSGGEAGMIVTNSATLYDRMLALGHNGRTGSDQKNQTFDIGPLSYGLKYRPHLFALRLAMSSFSRLQVLNRHRQENLDILTHEFSHNGVLAPIASYPNAQRGGFLEFLFRYSPEMAGGWSREAFVQAVQAEGFPIGVDRYSAFGATFRHLHEASIFNRLDDEGIGGAVRSSLISSGPLERTETVCRNLVTFPAFTKVKPSKLRALAMAVARVADFARSCPDMRAAR